MDKYISRNNKRGKHGRAATQIMTNKSNNSPVAGLSPKFRKNKAENKVTFKDFMNLRLAQIASGKHFDPHFKMFDQQMSQHRRKQQPERWLLEEPEKCP